jgi:drug/metabolite transporter (DMT)-like permease
VNDEPTFWFPVKRYGWGWGLPVRWQGWLVLVGFLGLFFAGIYYFTPRRATLCLLLYIVVLTALLIAIVALKGERPLRWRWGLRR